jgi:hypothetical protein
VRDALGLLGMAVFIAVIVAFAAAVTWVVVKFSPPAHSKQPGQ